MEKKLIQLSFDDGDCYDLRLAELLLKWKLPATFYIPTCCQLNENQIRWLVENGFEIGGHTTTHPQDIKILSPENQFNEIIENKEWLEEIIKKPIEKFCYPRGRQNEITRAAVARAGFREARITLQGKIWRPVDPLQTWTTEKIKKDDPGWYNSAAAYLSGPGDYFHFWGHSIDLEITNGWNLINNLFEKIHAALYSEL
jgi:peptidoglycan/xylan/chitin deacetylase (PgdA/CDA1 family)